MPKIATADDIRNRPILVNVPGTDTQILCHRPDPLQLIADGVLPLPTFAAVIDHINKLASAATFDNTELATSISEEPKTYIDFVNRWTCAAAHSPKVVLTEEEAVADPAVLWVEDLELEVRLEIVRRTGRPLSSARVRTAVTDFRNLGSDGAGTGPDGAAVRNAAVDAPADTRSAGGA